MSFARARRSSGSACYRASCDATSDVGDARMKGAALQPRPGIATVRSHVFLLFGRSWSGCVGFLSTDEEEGFHHSFTLDGDRAPRFELELFSERLANGGARVDPTRFAV